MVRIGHAGKASRAGCHQSIEDMFARQKQQSGPPRTVGLKKDKDSVAGRKQGAGQEDGFDNQSRTPFLQMLTGRLKSLPAEPKTPAPSPSVEQMTVDQSPRDAGKEHKCPVCGEAFVTESEKQRHLEMEFQLMDGLDGLSSEKPSGAPVINTSAMAHGCGPGPHAAGARPAPSLREMGRTFSSSRPRLNTNCEPNSRKPALGDQFGVLNIESLVQNAAKRMGEEAKHGAREHYQIENTPDGAQACNEKGEEESSAMPQADHGNGDTESIKEPKKRTHEGPQGKRKCFLCRAWIVEEEFEAHISKELDPEGSEELVIPGLATIDTTLVKPKFKRRRRTARPEKYDRFDDGPALDDFGISRAWEGQGAVGMGTSMLD